MVLESGYEDSLIKPDDDVSKCEDTGCADEWKVIYEAGMNIKESIRYKLRKDSGETYIVLN